MAGVILFRSSALKKLKPLINRRLITTSKKNSETVTAAAETKVEKAVTNKNWVSYGFETKSEADDRSSTHSVFFASITLCLVGFGYLLTYIPDYNLRDWAQREAFLELRRREAQGLPLVDPNLIDPAKIHLPSDEELGDTEIII